MITINGKHYAESACDYKLHPELYNGMIRRYKSKLEVFDKSLSLVATINKYGVLIGSTIDNGGKKVFRFIFHDDPLMEYLGGNITTSDVRRISLGIKEQYINTITDGGMFKAYPDHEYRFG